MAVLPQNPVFSDIFDSIPLSWTPKIVSETDIAGSQHISEQILKIHHAPLGTLKCLHTEFYYIS